MTEKSEKFFPVSIWEDAIAFVIQCGDTYCAGKYYIPHDEPGRLDEAEKTG